MTTLQANPNGPAGAPEPDDGSGFLFGADETVREQFADSVTLQEFLATAGTLTRAQRILLVEQALLLLEQNYAHMPSKAAMYAVNPAQRLRNLRSALLRNTGPATPESLFHGEMTEIFHSVRDLHTNYILPAPFSGKIAYLPFQVEEYVEAGKRRYVVSRLVQGFTAPGFGPGTDVSHWNGIPMATAVDLNAARFAGSNDAARRSRGVQSLTLRPLRLHLPPYEEWVTVTYLDGAGQTAELRQPWLVAGSAPTFADLDAVTTTATSFGLDLEADEVNRARKLLFAPAVVRAAREAGADEPVAAAAGDIPTMPDVFRVRTVTAGPDSYGHLRIFTFAVDDPAAFVTEFVRLLGLLPDTGLVLDVRGNGGGHIHASEFTLQTLTPRHVVPEPVQFLSTPLNLRLCLKHATGAAGIDLGAWAPSLEQAGEIGATYSAAFPITPEDGANSIGQRYHGPVVLITDARCYSATDIFAAGFQDHGIGPVLGVDENTGAGGANVWTHSLLKQLLETPTVEADSPYRDLPGGAGMRVAIRRTLRVGPHAGTPLEDLGVLPDERHATTRADVLQDNVDLLRRATKLLAAMPVRRLEAQLSVDGPDLELDLTTASLDRIDVHVDGRPRATVDLTGPHTHIQVVGAGSVAVVRLEGFDSGELVAARTLRP